MSFNHVCIFSYLLENITEHQDRDLSMFYEQLTVISPVGKSWIGDYTLKSVHIPAPQFSFSKDVWHSMPIGPFVWQIFVEILPCAPCISQGAGATEVNKHEVHALVELKCRWIWKLQRQKLSVKSNICICLWRLPFPSRSLKPMILHDSAVYWHLLWNTWAAKEL